MAARLPAWLGAMPLILASTAAQAKDDGQLWTSVSVNTPVADRLELAGEVITRLSGDRDGLYEIEVTALLGYALTERIGLWAGYVHDPLYEAGDFQVMEHRAREQLTFDDVARLGPGSISARLRLEQRWREDQPGTAWRMRPFVRYTMPLDASVSLVLSHESFVNLNTPAFQQTAGYERMRNLAAIRTDLVPGVRLELGYLNQYRFVRRGEDTRDHALSVSFSVSL